MHILLPGSDGCVYTFPCTYLYVFLSTYIYIYTYIVTYLITINFNIHISICYISILIDLYLDPCIYISLSTYIYIHQSIYISINLFIYIHLHICTTPYCNIFVYSVSFTISIEDDIPCRGSGSLWGLCNADHDVLLNHVQGFRSDLKKIGWFVGHWPFGVGSCGSNARDVFWERFLLDWLKLI